jgi:hypothetical protein
MSKTFRHGVTGNRRKAIKESSRWRQRRRRKIDEIVKEDQEDRRGWEKWTRIIVNG